MPPLTGLSFAMVFSGGFISLIFINYFPLGNVGYFALPYISTTNPEPH